MGKHEKIIKESRVNHKRLMGKHEIPYLKPQKVYWILGCWFLGFKVSKVYKIPISCFLIDIDPISKISKMYLAGLHNVPVPLFSKIVKNIGFQNFEICKNGMF